MPLTPLVKDDLVVLQSTSYAAQSKTDPVRDGQNEPLGDVWQANALNGLQIDSNIQYVDSKSRFATSSGDDLDSAFAIFSVFRVQPQPAGTTLSILPMSASPQDIVISVGTIFQTQTGLQFFVIADPTKYAYTGLGYIIPANTLSAIGVSVQCATPGAVGNVQANTITQTVAGLGVVSPGSISVTNPIAAVGGSEIEDDDTFKQRFKDEVTSGRWGTPLAILVAIGTASTGLTYQVFEGKNPDGSAHAGFFTVFVNTLGATGPAPQSLLDAVKLQIALVKACGITYTVVSPTLVTATASAQFVILPNYVAADVLTAASAAFVAYVNSIGLDASGSSTLLSYAKVSAVLVTVPGVKNVLSFTLNGGTSDIIASVGNQFVAGSTTFTAAP